MKQVYIFLLFLFLNYSYVSAQMATEVIVGLTSVFDIEFRGDDLYYINQEALFKFDVTETTPNTSYVAPIGPNALFLEFKDDELYISNDFATNITKLTIAPTPSAITEVATGFIFPSGMAFRGNELYIVQNQSGKISKIDVTATNPSVTDVITGLNFPTNIVFKDDFLYISHPNAGKISKIDVTAVTPTAVDVITGLSSPRGMIFKGDELYIAESLGGKVSKIDITDASPTVTDVVTGLDAVQGVAINGDILYMNDYIYGKIYKYSLVPLSVDEVASKNTVNVYPNPSNDFIQISGLQKREKYNIYTIAGSQVSSGFVTTNEEIDIQNLKSGVYFLKLGDKNTIRIIKK